MSNLKKISIISLTCLLLSIVLSTIAIAAEGDYTYDFDPGAWWNFMGLGIAFCIGIVVAFVIIILIAIWVYKDAEKRGTSGALWLIIVILTGIIGLIIWLVVRPPIGGHPKQSGRMCPNCGRPIPMDANICPYCGKKFESFIK